MQISKIHFNSLNPSLNQKVFSRPAKINFQAQNQDTFTKTEDFSNEKALELFRAKLSKCMDEQKLESYMQKLKEMCAQLEIEPRDLPIDEEHPGNLKNYQYTQLAFLVKELIFLS